jgi:hypothetical protein
MTQDHIKLGWLVEYLDQIEWMHQFKWQVYTDQDISESCIVPNTLHELDLTYDILLYIKEYTRPISELRRVLLHWLNAANPNPHQVITIDHDPIDQERFEVLIRMSVEEVQKDIICSQEEAEGSVLLNNKRVWIKLDRRKPDELIDLLEIVRVNYVY